MRNKPILVAATAVLLFGAVTASFATTPSFQGLGVESVEAISGNGLVLVGSSGRWTESAGWTNLGATCYAASIDGSVVVGELGRWTQTGGWVNLGDACHGVSADGSVVVGTHNGDIFRWTETGGMETFANLVGQGRAVSGDGAIIAGWALFNSEPEALRWENGLASSMGELVGGFHLSDAFAVSYDGSVAVGFSESALGTEAFRWTQSGGMIGLGDLAGGDFDSMAHDLSADGTVVVGKGSSALSYEAFLWTESNGMQNLQFVLENEHALDLTGWTLQQATGISDDGLTIVGYGVNPDGYQEAWIATIPEPATLLLLGLGGLVLRRKR